MLSVTGDDDLVLRLMTREPWRSHGHGLTARESQIQQHVVPVAGLTGSPAIMPGARASAVTVRSWLPGDGTPCGVVDRFEGVVGEDVAVPQ